MFLFEYCVTVVRIFLKNHSPSTLFWQLSKNQSTESLTVLKLQILSLPLSLQLPELRKRSRWDYLKKREAEKLEDLEAEIRDDEYLFSSEELTEKEKKELSYKRTLRDLATDYKKAGAKEQEERKNRYYMPEEKRSKVDTTCRDSHLLNSA